MDHPRVDFVVSPASPDNPCPTHLCITRGKKKIEIEVGEYIGTDKQEREKEEALIVISRHGHPGCPARDVAEKIGRSYLWIWTLIRDNLIDAYRIDNGLWVYEDEVRAIKDARDKERSDARRHNCTGFDESKRHPGSRA